MKFKKIENIWYFLLLGYALFLPYGPALPNIILGVMISYFIYCLVTKKVVLKKNYLKWVIVISGYYLFCVISLLYTENIEYGLKKIKLQSILFITPLIIITIKDLISKKQIYYIIQAQIISTTIFSIISILFAFKNWALKIGNEPYFLEQSLSTSLVNLHFLEFSLLVSVNIILLVFIKLYNKEYLLIKIRNISNIILIFLFLVLFMLNSRTSIFITTILVFLLYFSFYLKTKNAKPLIYLILFCTLIITLNYNFNKRFRDKIREAINIDNNYDVQKYWGGRGMRVLIWKTSIKVVKNNFVFGVGTGDQQDELDLYYKKYRINQLLFNNKVFNSHNIFLQILVCSGIVGFLLFCLSLVLPVVYSRINKNNLYVIFIILFVFSGMTQSFLQVNAGVAFFSFFNGLLFNLNFSNESITSS